MNPTRDALAKLCRHFPTDTDMLAAGWDAADVDAACAAYDEALAVLDAAAPALPVAWRVKDFADGWVLFHSGDAARAYADNAGNLIQPLYAGEAVVSSPPSPPSLVHQTESDSKQPEAVGKYRALLDAAARLTTAVDPTDYFGCEDDVRLVANAVLEAQKQ